MHNEVWEVRGSCESNPTNQSVFMIYHDLSSSPARSTPLDYNANANDYRYHVEGIVNKALKHGSPKAQPCPMIVLQLNQSKADLVTCSLWCGKCGRFLTDRGGWWVMPDGGIAAWLHLTSSSESDCIPVSKLFSLHKVWHMYSNRLTKWIAHNTGDTITRFWQLGLQMQFDRSSYDVDCVASMSLWVTKHPCTYNSPLHDVHTNDPIVIFTYVGPLWWQSKHCLLCGSATISRNILRCFSSCFLLLDAILTNGRYSPENIVTYRFRKTDKTC